MHNIKGRPSVWIIILNLIVAFNRSSVYHSELTNCTRIWKQCCWRSGNAGKLKADALAIHKCMKSEMAQEGHRLSGSPRPHRAGFSGVFIWSCQSWLCKRHHHSIVHVLYTSHENFCRSTCWMKCWPFLETLVPARTCRRNYNIQINPAESVQMHKMKASVPLTTILSWIHQIPVSVGSALDDPAGTSPLLRISCQKFKKMCTLGLAW